MGRGFLQVNVYADNIGQPVENAKVTITGNGVNISTTTNSSGQTELIALEAPDKKYSLTPQYEVKPYAEYDVKVEKEGLQTTIIKNVEVFDEQTGIEEVFMASKEQTTEPEKVITIDDNTLWGNYPPPKVYNPDTMEEIPTTGSVLPFPIVPQYVLVHDGAPSSTSANNYYVLFSDYIKNVGSSEIYATWPKETIKANVHAIITFALNRVYTEWYRSRGYNFTITSSPAYDQKYTVGRTIFLSIAQAVDEIFDKYIQKGSNNYPFFSQYNDGIKVNNSGWLSQWGSKDLGDRGYTALNILKHYYGSNITLKSAEVIEGIPTSFPGVVLKNGSCSEAVQKMQAELNIISGSYPLIPKINPVDGKFGPATENAVKVFQGVFSMTQDGIVGFATWYKISAIYVGVTKMIAGRYGG